MVWLVWLLILVLQLGNGLLHYAMSDPLLLKQGTRGFSLASLVGVGFGIVMQFLRMPSVRAAFKRETGKDLPDLGSANGEAASEPRSDQKGAAPFEAVLGLAVLALLGLVIACLTGCAHDPASKARQYNTAVYTGIGVGSALGIAGATYGKNQADHGDRKGAEETYGALETINASLHVAATTADATGEAITAGEKLGAKDYTAALAPLYRAGCDLQASIVKLAAILKKKIPTIPLCPGGP